MSSEENDPDCSKTAFDNCAGCRDETEQDQRVAQGYEYLDHPADIQLHGWGRSLEEALGQTATAMFGYMTELAAVDELTVEQVSASGEDMLSLIHNFLSALLYNFSCGQCFVCKRVEVYDLNRRQFKLRAQCYGETFDLNKHPQGTEVKAITYSNMMFSDEDDKHEVFVIVDI